MCQTQQLFLNPYPNAHRLFKIKLRVCVLLVDPLPRCNRVWYTISHMLRSHPAAFALHRFFAYAMRPRANICLSCLLDRGTLSQMCVRVFSNVEKIMIMASFRSFSYRPKTITTIFRRKKMGNFVFTFYRSTNSTFARENWQRKILNLLTLLQRDLEKY